MLSSSLYGDTVPGLHREFHTNDSLAATKQSLQDSEGMMPHAQLDFSVSMATLAHLFASTLPTVLPAPLHYKALQRNRVTVLSQSGLNLDYDRLMPNFPQLSAGNHAAAEGVQRGSIGFSC